MKKGLLRFIKVAHDKTSKIILTFQYFPFLVFEFIVHDQLCSVAVAHIPNSQDGFIRKRSTVSNLSIFTDFVTQRVDGCSQVHAVNTDYSKCFDSINHDILTLKLNGIGVRGDLLRWLEPYIRNRL